MNIIKEETTFELILDEEFFTKEDILMTANNEKVKILYEPTMQYNKWY